MPNEMMEYINEIIVLKFEQNGTLRNLTKKIFGVIIFQILKYKFLYRTIGDVF